MQVKDYKMMKNFILKLIKNDSYVLRYCLDKYKNNKKFVEAVKK